MIGFAAPAHAWAVDIYSQSSTLGGGGGEVWGSGTFTDRDSFTYAMSVKDRCPGDGLGVAFYFEMKLAGASYSSISQVFGVNRYGCEVQTVSASGKVNRQSDMIKMRALLCYTNGADSCAFVNDDGFSVWKINPNV
ncbi:hypothetical protein ASC77_20005 [Nocardioides sp. Root1257]|uniref:hypothetical protein n=1 Tax=unclassified Nocardioides TaxID=2615069 RepID=UPI0006F8D3FE|nr:MULTISPECIES: hypothetical protein [unclassified Nocardioides]KQW45068.1 hypothetical protein ASC77_20005 [Nocardioides sp. Root1257]KRC45928.1 hypothetical protein ASE24_15215 [Nocardioides sp. Root224]